MNEHQSQPDAQAADAPHEHAPSPPTTPAPTVPPTEPGHMPAPHTVWPIVLGIMCIIYAAFFELFGAACGLIGLLFSSVLEDLLAIDMTAAAMYDSLLYQVYYVVYNVVWLGLGVLLLVGSIQLIRRQQRATTLMNIWAVGALVAIVASVPFTIWSITEQNQFYGAAGPGLGFTVVMISASMLLYLVLPAFILIWFRRRAIRAETSKWT